MNESGRINSRLHSEFSKSTL